MDIQNNSILSQISQRLLEESYIVGIILCGSSNFSDDFHLDLFILVLNNDKNDKIKEIIDRFEHKINHVIKNLLDVENTESLILQDIFKNGKILYWNGAMDVPASQLFKIKPYSLFTFELSGMTQVMKVQFNYQLYGKKNTGQLQEWGGVRIAKSCFYVPHINKYKVTRFFNKFNIKNQDVDIWI
jgi:hypothetical protein